MEKYLPWLKAEAERFGTSFKKVKLSSFADIEDEADVIVNCTGLESRSFVPDRSIVPVKGQYLILRQANISLSQYLGDDDNPEGMSYAILRDGDLLIGGTEEFGVETPDFSQSASELLRRVSQFVPEIAKIDPDDCEKVVRFRPYRPRGICVEVESKSTKNGVIPVVMNYGHGGSGFSLSWGCAERVLSKVQILKDNGELQNFSSPSR